MITLRQISIEELGLTLEEGGPDLSSVALEREALAWAGRAGVIPSPYATAAARRLRFVVTQEPTDAAARLALMDWLKDLLMVGPIEIGFADAPMRVCTGLARVLDVSVASPTWVNLDPRIVVEIDCHTANKWDREAISRVIGTTPVEIPCGTLPHTGQLYFKGSHSGTLTITYRGLTGEPLGQLVLTVPASGNTLGSTDTLLVDLEHQELVKIRASDGAWVPVPEWHTGGDFFTCASKSGHRTLDAWGTLEATIAGLYRWRRNYH